MVSQQPTLTPRGDSPDSYLLSIVIPCFNEEEVISRTYDCIIGTLEISGFQLQLIFVNDGSKDRTRIILQRIAAADSRVKVVNLSRNFGHQAAVSAGLNYAHGDVTAIIDADLQDPPEVILEMIERWREGYDVVYGIRRQRKEVRWKRFCYALFYRLQQRIASIDAPLDAGDFSLIDRRVLTEINRLPEKNRFFRGLRAWIGFAQTGVEYERASRAAGVTKYPILKLLKLATDGIFNFSTTPLTVVFCLGMAISFLSFVALVVVIFLRISHLEILGVRASDVQGFASIIVTVLFIGGIQLICTGILGEYIGRIYQEVKARP
jgi:glycosyltransferase involved in cell wall biosynthesis